MKTNVPEDQRWQNLIALSAPTFAGDDALPYGFMTQMLARLRVENQQREMMERIGLRALYAAFATLAVTVCVVVTLNYANRDDLEPGIKGLVQIESVQVS